MKRYPTARLPRSDRRYGAGVMLAAALHGLAVIVVVISLTDRYEVGSERPGVAGGGGGGGGGRSIQYVELPPSARSSAPARHASVAAASKKPELPLESKETETSPEVVAASVDPATLFDQRTASLLTLGPGSGSGIGPGSGAGIGGGTGTGYGSGVGSGTGPGTGDGAAVYAPEPRAIIYPYEAPPASIRGRLFRIRFWVDARGRVDRVDVEPDIDDPVFRRELLARVSSWTFYPARTIEGKPVAGQLTITYSP